MAHFLLLYSTSVNISSSYSLYTGIIVNHICPTSSDIFSSITQSTTLHVK